MVMLNDLDRFHLVIDVIDRVPGLAARAAGLRQDMVEERLRCRAYTREHGEDDPEIADLDLAVLTVNAGSTSLKLHLVEDRRVACRSTPTSRPRRSGTASCTAATSLRPSRR